LPNADDAFFAPLGQRDKAVEGNRLDVDLQFACNLHNGFVQGVWMNIVADEININGQARTAE
jgi:hypothetical protein